MQEIMQTKLCALAGAYDTRADYVSFKEQEDTRLLYEGKMQFIRLNPTDY